MANTLEHNLYHPKDEWDELEDQGNSDYECPHCGEIYRAPEDLGSCPDCFGMDSGDYDPSKDEDE